VILRPDFLLHASRVLALVPFEIHKGSTMSRPVGNCIHET
jgi:hypothetical protein